MMAIDDESVITINFKIQRIVSQCNIFALKYLKIIDLLNTSFNISNILQTQRNLSFYSGNSVSLPVVARRDLVQDMSENEESNGLL